MIAYSYRFSAKASHSFKEVGILSYYSLYYCSVAFLPRYFQPSYFMKMPESMVN